MKQRARLMAVGALVLGSIVLAGTASANTGPVPAEWGKPTWQTPVLQLVGRQVGHLPGRLGNQHVTEVDTYDEESVVGGAVVDWWCPVGAVAPVYASAPSPCRVKAQYSIEYDYDHPEVLKEGWSPTVRYVNLRIPIRLLDSAGTVVRHGTVSIHVKAAGQLTQTWFEGDYQDLLTRQGAHLTGGHFLGMPWLAMSSVTVTDDEMWLLRYYNPAG